MNCGGRGSGEDTYAGLVLPFCGGGDATGSMLLER